MKKDLREVYQPGIVAALTLQAADGGLPDQATGEVKPVLRVTPNHSYWIMPDGSVEDVHADLGANADGSKYSHGIFAANWVKLRRQEPQRFAASERVTADRIERRARELERIIAAEESESESTSPYTEVGGRWFDEEGKEVATETVRAYRPTTPTGKALEGFDAHPGELAYKHAAQEQGWLRVRPQTIGTETVIFVEGIDVKSITPGQQAVIDRDVVQAGYTLRLLGGGAMGNRKGYKLGGAGSGN
jgi:hypothetical protein